MPDGLRQSSHYVSDGIYKHYYGIEGVSSTKLMYVAKNDDIYRDHHTDVYQNCHKLSPKRLIKK